MQCVVVVYADDGNGVQNNLKFDVAACAPRPLAGIVEIYLVKIKHQSSNTQS
jgi:hypothetical protein